LGFTLIITRGDAEGHLRCLEKTQRKKRKFSKYNFTALRLCARKKRRGKTTEEHRGHRGRGKVKGRREKGEGRRG